MTLIHQFSGPRVPLREREEERDCRGKRKQPGRAGKQSMHEEQLQPWEANAGEGVRRWRAEERQRGDSEKGVRWDSERRHGQLV